MTVCLLCLKTKTKRIIKICSKKGKDLKCSFIIAKYFWFPINELEDSKESICLICWNTLEEFHRFYQKIAEAHNLLVSETDAIFITNAKETANDALPTLSKPEDNNQTDLSADLFNAEIKIETNDLELLPAIEIIENIQHENRPLEIDIETNQTSNKRVKYESISSFDDDDSETDIPLSILQQTQTKKSPSTNSKDEKEIISLSTEDNIENIENNNQSETEDPADPVSNENFSDNEACDYNPESDDYEPTEECDEKPGKKAGTKKAFEKKKYNENISKFFEKLQCTKCDSSYSNFDVLRQHFRTAHKGIIPSAECCGRKFYLRRTLSDHAYLHLHPEYFKCCHPKCDHVFQNKNDVQKHEETHKKLPVTPNIVQCDKCPKTFASKKNLNEHQAVHISKSDYKFPCTVCGVKFATKRRARHHMRDIHSTGHSLICETCGKETRNYKALREHKATHTKALNLKTDPIQCDICGEWLKEGDTIKQHKSWVHKNHKVFQDENGLFHCDKCSKTFSSKQSFNEHEAVHISKSDYKFPCTVCGLKFATKRRAHHHMKDIHSMGRSLICETCGKQARNRKALRMHKVKHLETPEQISDPVQCDICGKWLKHADTLRQHKRWVHKQNTEQHCPICDKISPNLRALERHITRSHETESKFKCTMCTKMYKTARELKDHTNVHTKEVLYKCDICPKSFSRKSSLEKHKKNFHSDKPVKLERAQCEICSVWVNSSYYLKEHMIKMHEQSNIEYRCQTCGKVSVNEIALKRHIKRNHKQDDEMLTSVISSGQTENIKIEIQHKNVISSTAVEME